MLIFLYRAVWWLCTPILQALLLYRANRGKEDRGRLSERYGYPMMARPDGALLWLHAASVGEAQSALIFIHRILQENPNAHMLVTTGTVTSAQLMADKLPDCAFHRYAPMDHPLCIARFLKSWRPDAIFWMESELWPHMLYKVKKYAIPAFLLNARLSARSFTRWSLVKGFSTRLLSVFDIIFAQTKEAQARYQALGAHKVIYSDNIKYSAAPLAYHGQDLEALSKAIGQRPVWVYASTHAGEEALAAQAHEALRQKYPNLLTIIVPRHPQRRDNIGRILEAKDVCFRGDNKALPHDQTQIYIADTLGELGLFYRLADIAMIGRSFSDDGGGGHNPIEAAQLGCAVLSGKNMQYQQALFDEMVAHGCAKIIETKEKLADVLDDLLSNNNKCDDMVKAGQEFAKGKENIIDAVMCDITPILQENMKRG